jgi:chemotaxis protein MotB
MPAPRIRRAFQHRRGGSAWKVAYADFVTALMALFIVLWMMNSSQKVKASVSGYFRDPRGYTHKLGAGSSNSGEGLALDRRSLADLQNQIEKALRQMPEFPGIAAHVHFSVTGEGLRIDLLETEQGMFFVTGSPEPTRAGEDLLRVLAGELAKMPNRVAIEGHTDSRPFRDAGPEARYGNWELSSDRANAARRLLHSYGVRPEQIAEVRGFADRKLLHTAHPEDPANRRVSVVVEFLQPWDQGTGG